MNGESANSRRRCIFLSIPISQTALIHEIENDALCFLRKAKKRKLNFKYNWIWHASTERNHQAFHYDYESFAFYKKFCLMMKRYGSRNNVWIAYGDFPPARWEVIEIIFIVQLDSFCVVTQSSKWCQMVVLQICKYVLFLSCCAPPRSRLGIV